MKKGRLLVLAAASAAFCAAAVACGHEHEYGTWTITTAPTLTAEGSATRTCTANDGGEETVNVPALSNTEVWSSETTDATHTSAGKIVYTSVYGTVEIPIPQGEHSWGKWTIAKAPSATETGTAERACTSSDGGKDTVTLPVLTDTTVWTKDTAKSTPATHTADGKDVYTSSYGTVEVTVSKNADAHTYGGWVITTKPTLTTEGVATRTCTANDGGKETQKLAALSNTLMWKKDAEKSTPATHTAEGKDVYTSTYGTVEIVIPKDETHTYGDWTITKNPTATEEGTAERVCSADQHKDSATLPVLTDTTVWTKDTEKSVANSHTADGKDVYTSEYGEVTVVIPKSADHAWSAWEITQAPTLTATGTAKHSCTLAGCTEQDVTATVPALNDTAVWKKNTVAPDYNNAGKDVYTSDYGTVELPGDPKLVAPYDGETYVAFEVSVNDNGKASCWKWDSSTAKVTLDETGAGFGLGAVPFRVHVSISMVNDKTGEVLITEKEVVYEDGKDPSLATDGKISTFKGFVNMQTGVIVRPKDASWNNFYVYIPFGWDENAANAFKCDEAFAIACGKEDTAENIFISDDQAVFGVTFASDKAGEHAISVADFAEAKLVYVLKDNKVIASFAKDDKKEFVPADGYEGTYTLTMVGGGGDGTVILSGSGIIDIVVESGQTITGTYTVAEEGAGYTVSAVVEGVYYEIVLNDDPTGTIARPMVQITYNLNGTGSLDRETEEVNKNTVASLATPEDTDEKIFTGWYFDAACTEAVPDEFKPTADITLYAKWSTKFMVHAIVNEGDVRDIYYGVGETIGSRLPDFKIDPETKLTYVDSATNRVFVAWYTDPSMTESSALDETLFISEDDGDSITIYAKWVPAGTWSIEQDGRYHFEYNTETGAWQSNNKGINNSSATMQIVAIGDIVVTFEYKTSSENSDKLTIRKYERRNGNNSVIKEFGGTTNDWETYTVALTNGQLLQFTYHKDGSVHTGDDTAYIKGLKINGRPVTLSGTVDFKEGTYSSAGKDDLTLNGYGAFTWGEKAGSYSATDTENVFDMFVVAEGKQTERYTLTLSGSTYTVVENTVIISYNFGELNASLDSSTAFNGVAFTLPNAPEISGYVFRGWFDNEACEGTAITEITSEANASVYAKYDAAITVTVVYGNGMQTVTLTDTFANDAITLELPEPKDNKYPVAWHTDASFSAENVWASGTVVTGNLTLYCEWTDPHALMGAYKGANLDPSETGIAKETDNSYSETLTIDALGNSTGWKTGKIQDYDATTGKFVLNVSGSLYQGAADIGNGVLYIDWTSGKTDAYHDIAFFVKTVDDVTAKSSTNTAWDKGCTKLVAITYSDDSTMNLFINNRTVYGNVTWEAKKADGTAITSAADLAANVDYLKITAGATTFSFGKINNNLVVTNGTEGTYNGANSEQIILNGAGGIYYNGATGTLTAVEGADNTYKASFEAATYTIVINSTGKTFTIEEDKVTISYNFGGLSASLPNDTVFSGIAFTLPTAPDISGYKFRGWFDNEACEGTAITKITAVENAIVYAKYDAAVTVTLNYGGKLTDAPVEGKYVGDKYTPVLPTELVSGQAAEGWYTTSTFEENSKVTGEYTFTGDTTFYCKWIDVHPLYGTWKGYEVWSGSSFSSRNYAIDYLGVLSGSEKGQLPEFAEGVTSGYFNIVSGSSTYYAYYDLSKNFFAMADGTGANTFDTDAHFAFRTNETVSGSNSTQIVWNGNKTHLMQFKIGDETVYVFWHNDKIYPYANVSVKDSAGNAISKFAEFKTAGNVLTIKTYNNEDVAAFGYLGNTFVESDGTVGTYSGSFGELISNGYGTFTLGGTTITPIVDDKKLTLVVNNSMKVVELGAGTYTQVQDGYAGTYTLPDDAGTIVFDGLGGAGDGKTYVVSGATVTVYNSDGSKTAYGIDVENKILAGKSKFAGLTFTGTYNDSSWGNSSVEVIFDDGVEISGKMVANRSDFFFTGVLEGDTLTITWTKVFNKTEGGDVGTTMILKVSGNTITRVSGGTYTGTYFKEMVVSNTDFSL